MKEHQMIDRERKRRPKPDFYTDQIDTSKLVIAVYVLVLVELFNAIKEYLPL